MMLLEEIASIFITPFLLMFVVPKRVDDILQFIRDFTVDIEGVGNVCSFSAFDFENHGNAKYGSSYQRNHPYLLDWYYTSQPHNRNDHHPVERRENELLFTPTPNAADCWPPNLGVRGEDMEPSTSGDGSHNGASHPATANSFIEPPDFTNRYTTGNLLDNSWEGRSIEEEEEEGGLGWEEDARRRNLSRTTFMDDDDGTDDIESGIGLHFGDVYSSRPHGTSTSSTPH
ncbi:hypothetical protein Bca52824_028436 [Brassica carinata]|uniref:Autophagy-related protein 9 n=1 Tax=Brassica carinata TaxID=52824 RepID=A0A8X7VC82_BRACI|nr:hypothetical protein Bca52824_028436 [Brassica carinata]